MVENSAISMLINFSQSLPGIQKLIFFVFGAIGFVIAGSAVTQYYRNGSSFNRGGPSQALSLVMRLLCGSMCLSLPWLLDTVAGSFFTQTDTLIVESGVDGDADIQRAILMTISNLLAVIGYIAGGNGLLTWANGPTNQSQGWVGRGSVLIISGAVLTNMYIAVDYFARTFGMSALGTEYFKF